MSDMPKRRFWQIHLSTAVLLMFVSSGLLWANLTPKIFVNDDSGEKLPSEVDGFGWPIICVLQFKNQLGNPNLTNIGNYQYMIVKNRVMLDLSTGLLILILFWTTCGYFIRRREAR